MENDVSKAMEQFEKVQREIYLGITDREAHFLRLGFLNGSQWELQRGLEELKLKWRHHDIQLDR